MWCDVSTKTTVLSNCDTHTHDASEIKANRNIDERGQENKVC